MSRFVYPKQRNSVICCWMLHRRIWSPLGPCGRVSGSRCSGGHHWLALAQPQSPESGEHLSARVCGQPSVGTGSAESDLWRNHLRDDGSGSGCLGSASRAGTFRGCVAGCGGLHALGFGAPSPSSKLSLARSSFVAVLSRLPGADLPMHSIVRPPVNQAIFDSAAGRRWARRRA